MNNGIFRAYDIRGNVPDELNEENAYQIAKAFVRVIQKKTGKKNCTLVLGRDNRLSSPALFDAVLHGFLETGAHVYDVALCSSPHLYFSVLYLQADGGIHVTASHIPPPANGLKCVGPQATSLSPQSTGDGVSIEDFFKKNDAIPSEHLGSVESKDTLSAYIDKHFEIFKINTERLKQKKLNIAIDTGNGVSSLNVRALDERLPITIVPLYFELDGTFPHHVPNPMLPEATQDLQKKVLHEKCDLGVALDSDGDRILFIDEKGSRIMPDLTSTLIAKEILKNHSSETILYDLRSSKVLGETICAQGGIAHMSKVGHTFIKEQMRTENAFFASEITGHLYFREMGFFEAPLLAFLYLLSLLSSTDKTISELIREISIYSKTEEINIEIQDKEGSIKKIQEHFYDAERITHLDGVSIEYSDWWVNIRSSNTQNLLRINLEAQTPELRDQKVSEILTILKSLPSA